MLIVHDEVAAALNDGKPVVALESAVITAGLPRQAMPLAARLNLRDWQDDQPVNLALARAVQRAIRAAGAIPATVAIIEGRLHIGLDDHDIERLALDQRAGKASVTDLAHAITSGVTAGTTVSGTLAACRLTQDSARRSLGTRDRLAGIRVFTTGGIGGVHHEWQKRPDVSADLRAIAATPVCLVCSGGKSILDLPATLEALEAFNVPVLGHRTHLFPQFQSLGTSDLRVRLKVDDAPEAARLCAVQWRDLQQCGGVLLANPVPAEFAVDALEMTLAVEAAERAGRHRDIAGSHRTPFLLEEIARLTGNRSLHANIALLVNNASLAADVARAFTANAESLDTR